MAKRRSRKPRESQDETAIVFKDLDGSSGDEDLDVDLGEESGDPRRDDPFAEDAFDPDEEPAKPEKRQAGPRDEDDEDDEDADGETDESDDEAGEGEDTLQTGGEEITDPRIQTMLAEQARQIEELTRDRDLSRKEAADANKSLYETRAKQVDEGLTATRADLEKAIEDGDTKKQVELQERFAELTATKRELASLKERGDRAQQDARPAEKRQDDGPVQVEAKTPAAEKWMRGRSWINNPAYRTQNEDLVRVAGDLVRDRFDPGQDSYYTELTRRMRHLHPDLFANGQARTERRPDRQAVGRVSRDDPPKPRSDGKVVITARDKAVMRRFNLDPDNKDHLREFAKSKRESERETRRA